MGRASAEVSPKVSEKTAGDVETVFSQAAKRTKCNSVRAPGQN